MRSRLPVWSLVALVALCVALFWLRKDPPGPSPAAGTTERSMPAANEEWLRSFAAAEPGSAEFEALLRGVRDAMPVRSIRISTLLAAIPAAETPVRGVLCDLLADEHPAEVASELRMMLRAEADPDTAGRLLDALCAATMPAEGAMPDDGMLARAFEEAQAAADEELARGDSDAERRMEAAAAVIEVFPLEEARERLGEAAEAAADPEESDFIRGLEWELLVGSASADGAEGLLTHLADHPELLASEERKAATLEQIEVSDLSAAPPDEIRPLLVKLRPAPAADAAFARWFELLAIRGQVGGGGLAGLLETADALDVASLLHFGGAGWPEELRSRGGRDFERELRLAAAATDDAEARVFLTDAADALAKPPESQDMRGF